MLLGALLIATTAHAQVALDPNGGGIFLDDGPLLDIRMADEGDIERIVNGTETDEFPNVVALAEMSNWGGYVFCSGTLIDPEWVLTAGHCAEGLDQRRGDVVVFFGGDLMSDGAFDSRNVVDYEIHPDFIATTQSIQNDVALVKLGSPVNGVDLAVLNDEEPKPRWVGKDMTFVGFGITSDEADDSGIKRTTDIAIDYWDSQFIVSYTDGTNLCSGDSGGAAFEHTNDGTLELAGVNSWVSPGCVGGRNGVVRVDVYVPWIQQFVPDVLLGGDGSGSNPGDSGGGDSGGTLGSADSSTYDRDLPEPATPEQGDYPVGVGCDTAPGPATGWGAVMILGLLRLRRRRAA